MITVSEHAHLMLQYAAAHPRAQEVDIINAMQGHYDLTLSRYMLHYLTQAKLLTVSGDRYQLTPQGTETLQQSIDEHERRAKEKSHSCRTAVLSAVVSAVLTALFSFIIK